MERAARHVVEIPVDGHLVRMPQGALRAILSERLEQLESEKEQTASLGVEGAENVALDDKLVLIHRLVDSLGITPADAEELKQLEKLAREDGMFAGRLKSHGPDPHGPSASSRVP